MLDAVAHAETIKTRPELRSADALQIPGFVIWSRMQGCHG